MIPVLCVDDKVEGLAALVSVLVLDLFVGVPTTFFEVEDFLWGVPVDVEDLVVGFLDGVLGVLVCFVTPCNAVLLVVGTGGDGCLGVLALLCDADLAGLLAGADGVLVGDFFSR